MKLLPVRTKYRMHVCMRAQRRLLIVKVLAILVKIYHPPPHLSLPPPNRHQYILYYSSTTNYHPDILPLVPLCSWSLDGSLHVSRITARRIHHARLSASLVARPAPSLVPAEPHAAVVNGEARFTGRMGHADCSCFTVKWVLVQSFVSVFLESTLDQGRGMRKEENLLW